MSSNIGTQTKQAINKAGFLSAHEFIDEIYYENPEGLSKGQLRKEFLEKEIPVTRLDTHILYKTLEDPEKNAVTSGDLKRYIDDPQEFAIAKGFDRVGAAPDAWVDEEVIDDLNGLQVKSGGSQYDEPLLKLKQHIQNNSVDVEKVLISVDNTRQGEINRSEFLKFNKAIKSPLTVLEQKGLFGHITKTTGSKITIPDLTNLLTSSSSPSKPSKKPSISPGSSKLEQRISALEDSVRDKNKLIISLEKEVSYFKDLAESNKTPSASYTKDLNKLEKENRKLKEQEDKYKRDKDNLERIIKENISTPEAGDFVLLQKKIELLEVSLYEREKQMARQKFQTSSYQKYRKEIEEVKKRGEEERAFYLMQIEQKNGEIKMFREELDICLLYTSPQNPKTPKPQYGI